MPLYREFGEHAARLSDPAYKLYVTLLIYADHQTGTWSGTIADLSEVVGKSPATVRRLLTELDGHYIATEGRGCLVVTIHRYQRGKDAALTAVSHHRRRSIERTQVDSFGIGDPSPNVVSRWVAEGMKRLGKSVDNSLQTEDANAQI